MSRDIIIDLDPSRVESLTLGTTSRMSVDSNIPVPVKAKATVKTTEQWMAKKKYIPERGEIIIYSDRNIIDDKLYPGIKVGDGLAYVADLPFVGEEIEAQIMDALNIHIGNSGIHVTPEDKEFWNNKLNYSIDGEKLILNRN